MWPLLGMLVVSMAVVPYFAVPPPLSCCLVTLIILGAFYWVCSRQVQRIMLFLIVACVGVSWVAWRIEQQYHKQLVQHQVERPVLVRGMISSFVSYRSYRAQFMFKITQLNHHKFRRLVRLSWYGHPPLLMLGDHWELMIRLKPAHGLLNPAGFDARRWMWINHIVGTGYVLTRYPSHLLVRHHWGLAQWRQHIVTLCQQAISKRDYLAVISALTLGTRIFFQPQTWQVLQNTGTSHLVAISGLHVGLIAGLIVICASWLWRRSQILLRLWPAQKFAAVAALFMVMIYGGLAGLSLPTQRAMVMLAAVLFSLLMNTYLTMWQRLLLAAVAVLAWQPMAILSASFWLSFTAVSCLLYVLGGRVSQQARWRLGLRLQGAIFVGLAPVTLLYFQQLSLVMFLANVVAIPWVSLLVVPLCFLSAFVSLLSAPLAILGWQLAGYILSPLWWWLTWLAKLPGAVWHQPIPSHSILFAALIGIVLILSPLGVWVRCWGILWCLPLVVFKAPTPGFQAIWLTLLDVGQGLSAVIQTRDHTLVYDAGPKWPGGFDAGQSVVLPYLRYAHLSQINTLIISHGDIDHRGGAEALLRHLPVIHFYTSVPQRFKAWHAQACHTGQHWQWDGVTFTVLAPDKDNLYSDNNSSCVLRVASGHAVVLLPGDIERDRERWLVRHDKDHQLRADVLIAPHHGSKTSSTAMFVDAVQPRYVLLPVGYRNRYRLPNREVIQRYQDLGATLYSTAHDGAIMVHINAQGQITVRVMNNGQHIWLQTTAMGD